MYLNKQQRQRRKQIAMDFSKFLQSYGYKDTVFGNSKLSHCTECQRESHVMHVTVDDKAICPDCFDQRCREWLIQYK